MGYLISGSMRLIDVTINSRVHLGASAGSGDHVGIVHLSLSIEVREAPHDGSAVGGVSLEGGPGRVVADGCSDGCCDGNPVGTGSQAIRIRGDDSLECSVVYVILLGSERHAEAPGRNAISRSSRNLSKGSASQLLTALEGFACRNSSVLPSNSSEIVVNSDNEGVTIFDSFRDLVVFAGCSSSSVGHPNASCSASSNSRSSGGSGPRRGSDSSVGLSRQGNGSIECGLGCPNLWGDVLSPDGTVVSGTGVASLTVTSENHLVGTVKVHIGVINISGLSSRHLNLDNREGAPLSSSDG